MRYLAILTILWLPAMAVAESRFQSGTTRWDGRQAKRGETLMKAAMLDVHNGTRRAYGSPPLAWDDALAADARRYARLLAERNQMAHDPQNGVRPVQGENLFMGTLGAYSYTRMAQLWVDERRWFRAGVFPDVVTAGHWSRVGHYTQIIWPETRRFGCALASNRANDFLVCRYLPAGNYYGTPLRRGLADR